PVPPSDSGVRMSLPNLLKGRLSIPVVGSPLFIISNPDLVLAQCTAGVVGSFPSLNARPVAVFEHCLQHLARELEEDNQANPDEPAAQAAVDQIVHKSSDRLQQDPELGVKYKVPIVITSLGAGEDVNEAVHAYGAIVLHPVINNFY